MPKPHVVMVNGAKRDYATALTAAGYRVTTFETVREALASRARPDAVVMELLVPEGGLEEISQAWRGRSTRAMTVIALADQAHEDVVVKAGAAFCRHPCPPHELVAFVERALAAARPLRPGRRRKNARL